MQQHQRTGPGLMDHEPLDVDALLPAAGSMSALCILSLVPLYVV